MAATGCEFVALGDAVFQHPGGPAEAVKAALAAIGEAAARSRDDARRGPLSLPR